ncbi:MAG: hypothetical protein N3G20_05355 [Verrucomicrobiae bacterium]|nr:hypothetical protein [Verrucomicrobiae bacterium]
MGQMLTVPATICPPALAASVNAVGKTHLEDRFLWFVRHLLDPQWERVEIHQQLPVFYQPAAGHMRVQQYQMASRVLGCVGPDQGYHLGIVVQAPIVMVHQLCLPEMNCFAAHVNKRGTKESKPKFRFRPAYVRD